MDLAELAGQVDLNDEITMLRVVMRRMFQQVGECEDPATWAAALGALGSAATRLAGLLRTQKLLAGGGSDVAEALSAALREVTSEFVK